MRDLADALEERLERAETPVETRLRDATELAESLVAAMSWEGLTTTAAVGVLTNSMREQASGASERALRAVARFEALRADAGETDPALEARAALAKSRAALTLAFSTSDQDARRRALASAGAVRAVPTLLPQDDPDALDGGAGPEVVPVADNAEAESQRLLLLGHLALAERGGRGVRALSAHRGRALAPRQGRGNAGRRARAGPGGRSRGGAAASRRTIPRRVVGADRTGRRAGRDPPRRRAAPPRPSRGGVRRRGCAASGGPPRVGRVHRPRAKGRRRRARRRAPRAARREGGRVRRAAAVASRPCAAARSRLRARRPRALARRGPGRRRRLARPARSADRRTRRGASPLGGRRARALRLRRQAPAWPSARRSATRSRSATPA